MQSKDVTVRLSSPDPALLQNGPGNNLFDRYTNVSQGHNERLYIKLPSRELPRLQ